MAAATLANEPGTLGISSRIVRLYEAEGSWAIAAEAYPRAAAPKPTSREDAATPRRQAVSEPRTREVW
jgi:hypothetical protein